MLTITLWYALLLILCLPVADADTTHRESELGAVLDAIPAEPTVLLEHATVAWSATTLESPPKLSFPSTATVTSVNGVVCPIHDYSVVRKLIL